MIRTILPVLALCCAGPAFAQQQGEFDLPETATPAPTPGGNGQVQGPVDDSGIIPVGPRVIRPTGTPTAAPTAAPTATPGPVTTAAPTASPTSTPARAPRTAPRPTQRTPAPEASASRTAQDPARRLAPDVRLQQPVGERPAPATGQQGPSITDPIPSDGSSTPPGAATASNAPPLPTAPGPIEAQSAPADPPGTSWWWIVAALVGAAILAAAAYTIRRKQTEAPIVVAPKASPGLMPAAAPKAAAEHPAGPAPAPVTEPDLQREPDADPVPPTAFAPAANASPASSRPIAPLGLETQVTRLQRSLRAVTVTAKVVVTNRGTGAIANAVLQGDLVGASKAAPLGQQLANAVAELDELEELGTLAPGERREAIVQVRRELPEIEGIRQGNTIVFIPLLRIRFAGDGATPLASTVLVGHPPERSGGKPTPFLADAPPQNYDNVVGRALG